MLALERKQIIIERLRSEKKVYVAKLSEELDVAQETIRRDLKELEHKGIAVRSFGGAVLRKDAPLESFLEREASNSPLKKIIADLVQDFIHNDMTIMADTSTTAKAVVESLTCQKNLTVITNSYRLINDLSEKSSISFIGTGGQVLGQLQAFTGIDAINTIKRYNADIAILGCNGVNINSGFTESNIEECAVKLAMSSQAKRTFIVTDHTKFERIGLINAIAFNQVDCLITDEKPADEWLSFFKNLSIELIYP